MGQRREVACPVLMLYFYSNLVGRYRPDDQLLSITKVYPPPRHQGNSPILGDIIISSLSGFVGFGWENFSQPVSSLEV